MSGESKDDARLVATGIAGLDEVLGGGFPPERLYLVEGNPGSGKTTLALQCLLEGAARGESCLYVTLSETKAELIAVARSHGWSLDGISLLELAAPEAELDPDEHYAMFQPSEVELAETTRQILAEVDRARPARVVIDSLSELRLLAQNPLRFRRQILALKQYFIGRSCTVFLLDDKVSGDEELKLQSIAHGVLTLEQLSPEYGAERRRLRVVKLRGRRYRGGYHDFIIERGGLAVFPRLAASDPGGSRGRGLLESGDEELDRMMGGGLPYGSSAVLLGPAGSGKSTLSLLYAQAAAERGERAVIFTFDEREQTILERTEGLGMPIADEVGAGHIRIQPIDTAELSPGEFANLVRSAVQDDDHGPGARIVVIDSLNGYLGAMPEERYLLSQLHELLTFLGHRGVVTFLVVAQHGLFGGMTSPVDTTYLADAIILFRYFEAMGEVRQAISVVKKRGGHHERTIRELTFGGPGGLIVGPALREFRGVLTGNPSYDGPDGQLEGPDHG